MISHKHKCIFIHIPKTAGVSIYKVFGTGRKQQNHATLEEYMGWQYRKKRNYFKFCFVRNPWDRFLSTYFYLKKGGRGGRGDVRDAKILNQFENFQEFVGNFDKIKNDSSDRHFYEQFFWMDGGIDFIGKFENFQEDFNTVCDKIGIPQKELPHKNKSNSNHKHYTEYYDDETRDIVAEKYAKDIEYLGYNFGE